MEDYIDYAYSSLDHFLDHIMDTMQEEVDDLHTMPYKTPLVIGTTYYPSSSSSLSIRHHKHHH
jgi:hypothetical protein